MSDARLEFFTPVVGRFVYGSITEKRTKDYEGRPIEPDKQQFEFGVAFDKAAIWPMLTEQWYPWLAQQLGRDQNALNRLTNWFGTLQGFSMKVKDGDAPNSKGQFSENTKGCFVLQFSTLYAPKTVGPDPAFTEIDAATVKRGYYVQVAGSIVPNELAGDRAGVYLNGSVVRLIAEGDEIAGGVDAASAFQGAAAPTQLPPGARPLGSSSPAAGAFGAGQPQQPPAMPGLPSQGAQPPAMPGQPQQPPALPGQPGQPHTAILNGPTQYGNAQPPSNMPGGATGSPGSLPGLPPLPGTQ